MNFFIERLFTSPQLFFAQLIVVVFSVCCHEYAHARVALWQGDDTAAREGHLTLNPLKQMGVISLIMFILAGIAWGAVPVNRNRMRHRYSDALVSFAGPFVNISFFLLSTFALVLMYKFNIENQAAVLLFHIGAIINFMLFVINMLPIPSLDGWGVFSYFLPLEKLIANASELVKGAMLLIFVLAFTLCPFIAKVGSIVMSFIFQIFQIIGFIH